MQSVERRTPLLNLKRKILAGYGFAVVLMGMVITWSVVNLVVLGRATGSILEENYRSILAAENMVDALERQDSAVLLLFLSEREEGLTLYRQNEATFLQWLARAKDNITIDGEAALVQSIEDGYLDYRSAFFRLTDAPEDGTPVKPAGIEEYWESVYPVFTAVRDSCIQLRNLNEETMYNASLRARRSANNAIWSTVGVSATALILALLFSLVLASRISKPLEGFMSASRKISAGDYSVYIPVNTNDELGSLAREFNRMASMLSEYNEMNIGQLITEKQKGEAILSSIEDGMMVFDTEMKVIAVNPAAADIVGLGYPRCSGMSCDELFSSRNLCDLIRKTVDAGLHQEVPDENRLVSLHGRNGERQYLFSVTPIRGLDSHLTGIVLLLRDVTRLTEVERTKSEFVSAAAHELRTPLTGIEMSIGLLMEQVSGFEEKDVELLKVAESETRRMKALVNDLLDLSRLESGVIEMNFEEVDVSSLFQKTKEIFSLQMEKAGINLIVDQAGQLPPVRADSNKIMWVVSNLVSNALRFVSKGGTITLSATQTCSQVRISVTDDGAGIPLEYQSRIFQRFVQVKGRDAGGTGLGLAICREMVRAHGGTIWVESTPGLGSTFTFTLPAVEKVT
jgi:NtrC-family two-component system sensor histidine kinase KinB